MVVKFVLRRVVNFVHQKHYGSQVCVTKGRQVHGHKNCGRQVHVTKGRQVNGHKNYGRQVQVTKGRQVYAHKNYHNLRRVVKFMLTKTMVVKFVLTKPMVAKLHKKRDTFTKQGSWQVLIHHTSKGRQVRVRTRLQTYFVYV